MTKISSNCTFYGKDCFNRLLWSCLILDFVSLKIPLESIVIYIYVKLVYIIMYSVCLSVRKWMYVHTLGRLIGCCDFVSLKNCGCECHIGVNWLWRSLVYISMYFVCVYVCVYVCVCVCVCVCVWKCIHLRTHMYTHICIYIYFQECCFFSFLSFFHSLSLSLSLSLYIYIYIRAW